MYRNTFREYQKTFGLHDMMAKGLRRNQGYSARGGAS